MKFTYPSGSEPLDGYTIKRGIGIGGFGEVYFALSDAGKEVALKKIQRNLDVELRGVTQCLNLKHVNLISLWDIRRNDHGESWVVMEYVPGPSLRDIVESNPNGMPEDQAKIWFASTASGVAYLHEHGIVHRDLKPGNIFCDEHEQIIKIGDYGLSKFISCSRRSGHTESVGTFHYMAPEIGKGVYGKEIDIYALGIILFEMLTGAVPFEGESSQEIIMKHLTSDPDLDLAPDKFRDVIATALRKDPELRFNSVSEMVAELPWSELAANSQKIISQTSVGPMVQGVSDLPMRSHLPTDHPAAATGGKPSDPSVQSSVDPAKLPPIIISGDEVEVVPDIVFGPLTDNSRYPTGTNNPGSVRPNPNGHQRPAGRAEPIRIVDEHPMESSDAADQSSQFGVAGNEPIAQAVQSGLGRIARWWNNANVSTPVKLILLIVAGLVVIKNSQWLLPLTLGLSLVYLMYLLGRIWFADAADAADAGENPKTLSPREIQLQITSPVRAWLAARPSADRVTELVGSLLVGAFACIVLNLLGFALGGGFLESTVESWANYSWLTLTSIVACWSLLGVTTGWEHQEGNGWLRRLVLVGVGGVVGAIAFFSASSFNINLAQTALADFQARQTEQFVVQGIPMFPAYLIFFAGLFGILRWWRQIDPVRKTRLSIVNVTLCLIWATVLSHLLGVPLTGNCILAVVISVSVQLASPWLHPTDREEISAGVPADSLT